MNNLCVTPWPDPTLPQERGRADLAWDCSAGELYLSAPSSPLPYSLGFLYSASPKPRFTSSTAQAQIPRAKLCKSNKWLCRHLLDSPLCQVAKKNDSPPSPHVWLTRENEEGKSRLSKLYFAVVEAALCVPSPSPRPGSVLWVWKQQQHHHTKVVLIVIRALGTLSKSFANYFKLPLTEIISADLQKKKKK